MKTQSAEPPKRRKERWREPRYVFSVEIEVNGIDSAGRPFTERTRTRDVSEWGCGFYLSFPLEKHALVAVRVVEELACCFKDAPPVMFMVAHVRKTLDGWVMGASKIQGDRLWDVSVLATPPEENGIGSEARLHLLNYTGIDNLDEATLDSLNYGVIQVDRMGRVLKYNEYESQLANRKKSEVIGKNFFLEVAPCTAVKEFYGRFQAGVKAKKLCDVFEFEFAFQPNPRTVLITMLYSQRTDTVFILVQALEGRKK